MTFHKERYPADWPQIRERIIARAKNECEMCHVPNHVYIVRSEVNGARFILMDADGDYWLDGEHIKMGDEPDEFACSPMTHITEDDKWGA